MISGAGSKGGIYGDGIKEQLVKRRKRKSNKYLASPTEDKPNKQNMNDRPSEPNK
jgi:hypothetical protein